MTESQIILVKDIPCSE